MMEELVKIVLKSIDTQLNINADTKFKEDLNLDSFDTIILINNVEEEFGIEIPYDDLNFINTLGELNNYIKKKCKLNNINSTLTGQKH